MLLVDEDLRIAIIGDHGTASTLALLAVSLAGYNPGVADQEGVAKPDSSVSTFPLTPSPPGAPGGAPAAGGLLLADAVGKLLAAVEKRDGYERDSFHHGIDEDGDACSPRPEALLAEATTKPTQGVRCAISEGAWMSGYEKAEVADAGKLDIHHMVPLAEAGAAERTAGPPSTARRTPMISARSDR
ncbi:hypothetical protein ABZ401_25295 [Streptomyces sp. NPDC005892]|uniref:hypothetical protein n=1 Tax=Streptomyces sp. NPDC005892 TaxID=3155593 RepID=UPI0033E8783E